MNADSIHPRFWKHGNGQKHNTSKPPKDMDKGILGKRLKKLASRRRNHKEYPHKDFESKMPGSMKG